MGEQELTRAGWPRPIVNGWSIPWVSPTNDLGKMDRNRVWRGIQEKLCPVCGEALGVPPFYAVLRTSGPLPSDMSDGELRPMDSAVMHRRCLLLAAARCPKLQSIAQAGKLRVVEVSAEPHFGSEAEAVVPGRNCRAVALADLA